MFTEYLSQHFAMNLIGIFIIFLMLIDFGSKVKLEKSDTVKVFRVVLFINAALLLTDVGMAAFNGVNTPVCHVLNILCNMIYYVLQLNICVIFSFYCNMIMYGNRGNSDKTILVFVITAIISIIAVTISTRIPFIFEIDEYSVSGRGPYYIHYFILGLLFIAYSLIRIAFALLEKERTNKHGLRFLLAYPLIPLVVVPIQVFNHVSIIWVASVAALLIVYFNHQNAFSVRDELTGIGNKTAFDETIRSKIKKHKPHRKLYMIVIDIDNFKGINDSLGHLMGDKALQEATNILCRTFERDGYVFRLYGDEFGIVIESGEDEILDRLFDRLQAETERFNAAKEFEYELHFSYGYAVMDKYDIKTADELFREADLAMYKQKVEYYSHSGRDRRRHRSKEERDS